jgi:SH3-like domain-containing protein
MHRPVSRALIDLRVAAGLLAALAAALAPTGGADAASRRFVRVSVDVANLRAQPSRTAARVRPSFENEPLRVVGEQGQWLAVQDFAGESAWIYAPLTDRRTAVVVVRDAVNVRVRPGTAHAVAFTAERGVNLLVLGREGRWLRVRHEVGEGWIHDSLVWGLP